MKVGFVGFVAALIFSSSSFADGGACRLVVHVHFKSGKKSVAVEEVRADSRTDCKYAAEQRKLDSESDEVSRANVVFSYRDDNE